MRFQIGDQVRVHKPGSGFEEYEGKDGFIEVVYDDNKPFPYFVSFPGTFLDPEYFEETELR